MVNDSYSMFKFFPPHSITTRIAYNILTCCELIKSHPHSFQDEIFRYFDLSSLVQFNPLL